MSDALYAVLTSDENHQISWYCKSCQRGAKAIMSYIIIMHERQDQFENKLKKININTSKVSDLQSQTTHESFVASHVQPDINKEDVVATVCTQKKR